MFESTVPVMNLLVTSNISRRFFSGEGKKSPTLLINDWLFKNVWKILENTVIMEIGRVDLCTSETIEKLRVGSQSEGFFHWNETLWKEGWWRREVATNEQKDRLNDYNHTIVAQVFDTSIIHQYVQHFSEGTWHVRIKWENSVYEW